MYDWLLALHVTGAFFVVGGSVMAATLNVLALRNVGQMELTKDLRQQREIPRKRRIGFHR